MRAHSLSPPSILLLLPDFPIAFNTARAKSQLSQFSGIFRSQYDDGVDTVRKKKVTRKCDNAGYVT